MEKSARPKSRTCGRGHVIAEVGRYKSGGCKECARLQNHARYGPRLPDDMRRQKQKECCQGHVIADVGRTKNGQCKECKRIRQRERRAGVYQFTQKRTWPLNDGWDKRYCLGCGQTKRMPPDQWYCVACNGQAYIARIKEAS